MKNEHDLKKERLELLEKKMDIRKKRLEAEKEQMNIEELQRKLKMDEQRLLLSKIHDLGWMLADVTVDEDRTLFGGEPFLKRLYDENEQQILKTKIFEILKRF